MNKLDEYKEIYYKELDRAESLKNKISTSLTFLTLTGSALSYIFNNIIQQFSVGFEFFPSLVVFLACISFILFTIEGILFIKAHTNSYAYFPIKEFHDFEIQCEEYIWENNEEKDNFINNAKIDLYYNACIYNRKANNDKVKSLNKLYMLIIINLVILLSTYVLMCFVNKK